MTCTAICLPDTAGRDPAPAVHNRALQLRFACFWCELYCRSLPARAALILNHLEQPEQQADCSSYSGTQVSASVA